MQSAATLPVTRVYLGFFNPTLTYVPTSNTLNTTGAVPRGPWGPVGSASSHHCSAWDKLKRKTSIASFTVTAALCCVLILMSQASI